MTCISRKFAEFWFRDRMIAFVLFIGICIWGFYLLRLHELQRRNGPQERPENFPEILQVPNEAKKINFQSPDINNSSPGRWSVNFVICKSYPAEDLIVFLTEPLQKSPWTRLKHNLLFPNNPNIGRWVDKFANYDGYDYRVWESYWVSSSDETVNIHLCYFKETDSSIWEDELRVSLIYTTSNGPNRNDVLRYRELHSEEFPKSKEE